MVKMKDIIKEAEELVGRKLKPTEEALINLMFDKDIYKLDVNDKGDIVFMLKK